MRKHTSINASNGAKTLFIDVMNLTKEARKAFIERNTPHMAKWLKEASLR